MIALRHSLFLKIFLWFGSAMLTMIAITFVVTELARNRPFGPRDYRVPDVILRSYANAAVSIYEREGSAGLAAYHSQLERTTEFHAFLFGNQLNELSGKSVPPEVLEIARQAAQTNDKQIAKNQLVIQRVTNAREQYVWVAGMPPPHSSFLFDHLLHLGAMMMIGAAFCYWLARYLTTPVTKLRNATNEVARGNLAARVGPSLGKRRDELASLGADFDAMATQIESLLKAQRRLLGDISHELRSPLARLNVALELAYQRAGPAATTALERIEHETRNLNEMIGQLLALTRVESGSREITKAAVDLTKLVEDIAEDADFEARSRNRSVRISRSEPCAISGSEELLRPAIENVVRNAIQYTAEQSEVEIEIRANGSSEDHHDAIAEITVRDHGAGVPESALAEIFRPFYRVDDARDRESGGTGLGLAITERAVHLHGGTVGATNAPGGGLIVKITLPKSGSSAAAT